MNEELPQNSEVPYRVAYLIAGYIRNSLTEAEKDELDEWVTASDENMRLFAQLTDEKTIEKGLKERGLYDADKAVERLKQKIGVQKKKRARTVTLFTVSIAASVLLVAVIYYFTPFFPRHRAKADVPLAKTDLPPGGDRAVLQLADGRQIILDSTKGNILQQGDLQVSNANGTVSYRGTTNEVQLHTLSTPRGGQYQLTLADGSTVWLNAESSIRFPTAFTGNERKVEITGEAYFEVVHNEKMPFKVLVNGMEVEDLGTAFNINAYPDEASVKTTLIEGQVRIVTQGGTALLKPGQQAIKDGGELRVDASVDTDEVTAWKKGLFEFKDAPIEDIMREVARWYNVDVKYEARPTHHFNASIERRVPVSKLFQLLELTEQVHFSVDQKTIIVKP
jgi:ferric-dicitrate binding protein FerR (iron transport regulator)